MDHRAYCPFFTYQDDDEPMEGVRTGPSWYEDLYFLLVSLL